MGSPWCGHCRATRCEPPRHGDLARGPVCASTHMSECRHAAMHSVTWRVLAHVPNDDRKPHDIRGDCTCPGFAQLSSPVRVNFGEFSASGRMYLLRIISTLEPCSSQFLIFFCIGATALAPDLLNFRALFESILVSFLHRGECICPGLSQLSSPVQVNF